jgi:hypothetical protein
MAETGVVPLTVDPVAGAVTDPVGGVLSSVTVTDDEAVFPDVSLATAVNVCVPSPTVVEFQLTEYGAEVTGAPRFCPSTWNWTLATATLSVALADTVADWCTSALLAGAVTETVGGEVSGLDTTGEFMSAAIWAAVRVVLYTRTSSMSPLKYSPHTLSPPIRSGLVELAIVPDTDRLATCVPFT